MINNISKQVYSSSARNYSQHDQGNTSVKTSSPKIRSRVSSDHNSQKASKSITFSKKKSVSSKSRNIGSSHISSMLKNKSHVNSRNPSLKAKKQGLSHSQYLIADSKARAHKSSYFSRLGREEKSSKSKNQTRISLKSKSPKID